MSRREPPARVVDFLTGEPVDVRTASTEELATYLIAAGGWHRDIAMAEEIVNDEILARMDRDLSWTQVVDDGAHGYSLELRASSPAAGATHYPPEQLERELNGLVEANVISAVGAEKACRRRVKLVLDMPWGADLPTMVHQLKRAPSINVANMEAHVTRAEPERAAVAVGINALRRVPGALQALDRVRRTLDPPVRKVKVTVRGSNAIAGDQR